MTTVVVTGAAGFLGRALTTYLAEKKLTVIPVSRQQLAGMHQVQDYSLCPPGDVLIHLAEEPDRGKVNRLGSGYMNDASNVAKALSRRGYQRMIYASSGVVYGDENEIPCRTDMPVIATDVYSQTKLINEQIMLDAGGVAVRISNLFGAGMSANNVMSDIIRQVPGAGPLRVRDDKPVRDYLHVSDAASAFGMLAGSSYCGIMNVGSGIGTSVRMLAELALASVGQSAREIIATAPASRRSINVLDISETRKMLGWAPAASLKDQLTHLINNPVLNNRERLAHE